MPEEYEEVQKNICNELKEVELKGEESYNELKELGNLAFDFLSW